MVILERPTKVHPTKTFVHPRYGIKPFKVNLKRVVVQKEPVYGLHNCVAVVDVFYETANAGIFVDMCERIVEYLRGSRFPDNEFATVEQHPMGLAESDPLYLRRLVPELKGYGEDYGGGYL